MSVALDVLVQGSSFPHLRGSVVLVKSGSGRWLVDCGAREDRDALLAALDAAGHKPADIGGLLLTHLHYDHCDNLDLFPTATLYVHRREMEGLAALARLGSEEELMVGLRSRYEVVHPVYQRFFARWVMEGGSQDVLEAKRVRLLEGELEVDDGVTMVESPGHSMGHMSIRLAGEGEETLVVGDLVASVEEYRLVATPAICWNCAERARSLAALAQHAGPIVPGHGASFRLAESREQMT